MGIDFGTTRTVVARVEGGNYPLVTFEAEWGDGQEWYPSLIAGKGSQREEVDHQRRVLEEPERPEGIGPLRVIDHYEQCRESA